MARAVGIDLGTTNSAVAHIDRHGQPVVTPNHLGKLITPSVICFGDGNPVVGEEAKELQAAGDPNVAAFFKRQMGVANFVFYTGGRDYSAVDLSAILLKALKHDAKQALGESITHAVITVPAYFMHPQREETTVAGREAGLEVLQTINEPTAAAVAYGLRGSTREQTLLVYDLGGGTFDVTLLRLGPKEIRILTSDGDHELGGKDWDDRIVEFLASRFEAELGSDPLSDIETMSDLQVRAEEVKKRLTVAESAPISIVHDGRRGRYTLERAKLEEITADLMERTIALTTKVMEDKGLRPSQIDGVLLVGGSTRMPMVHQFIRRHFGREPMTGVDVDEAVALGAAVIAAERMQEVTGCTLFSIGGAVRPLDVTNHSLGMIAINEDRSAYINSLILPKNSPIPSTQTRPYQHRIGYRGGGSIEVFLTQGESESPSDVTYLNKYVLHDLPSSPGGLTVLDVEYSYDLSGMVQVSGSVRGSGEQLRVSTEPLPPDVPERFLRPPEESIETVHVTAYLAFDLSGSMMGEPLREAQRAAYSFLHNIDLSHCSLGLIAFSDQVAVKLEACQNARKIERAIDSLSIGETGFGNFAHPFTEVKSLLNGVSEPKFVITLADGVWCNQERAVQRARDCHAAGIESIAIGFGEADKVFLQRIASCEEASFFTSMGGLVETFTNIAQVLTESHGGAGAPNPGQGRSGSFLSQLFGG